LALIPISIVTASVGDADEWSDDAIVTLGMATDFLWMLAGVLCLYSVRVLEKRMRRREAELVAGTRRVRPARASGV